MNSVSNENDATNVASENSENARDSKDDNDITFYFFYDMVQKLILKRHDVEGKYFLNNIFKMYSNKWQSNDLNNHVLKILLQNIILSI